MYWQLWTRVPLSSSKMCRVSCKQRRRGDVFVYFKFTLRISVYVSVMYMYFRDSGNGWIVILYKRVVHSLWIVGELGVIKV